VEHQREAALVHARELFADDARVKKIAARAAVGFGHPRAEKSVLSGLAPRLAIDGARFTPALLMRDDLALGELPKRSAKHLVLFAIQRAVHARVLPRRHSSQ
jgi:hypothetical protein